MKTRELSSSEVSLQRRYEELRKCKQQVTCPVDMDVNVNVNVNVEVNVDVNVNVNVIMDVDMNMI